MRPELADRIRDDWRRQLAARGEADVRALLAQVPADPVAKVDPIKSKQEDMSHRATRAFVEEWLRDKEAQRAAAQAARDDERDRRERTILRLTRVILGFTIVAALAAVLGLFRGS